MLSVYKDQVPEAGQMTEEVAKIADSLSAGADTGGVDRVDIHPPFFSKKKFEMSLYLK